LFVSIICLVKGKKLQILFQNRCQLLQCSFTKLSKQNINYHQRNELEVIFLTYIIFLMNWVAFKAALYCVELLQIIIVKHWKLIILKEIITVQQEYYFKSSFETFQDLQCILLLSDFILSLLLSTNWKQKTSNYFLSVYFNIVNAFKNQNQKPIWKRLFLIGVKIFFYCFIQCKIISTTLLQPICFIISDRGTQLKKYAELSKIIRISTFTVTAKKVNFRS
jgi:hypothetical protein